MVRSSQNNKFSVKQNKIIFLNVVSSLFNLTKWRLNFIGYTNSKSKCFGYKGAWSHCSIWIVSDSGPYITNLKFHLQLVFVETSRKNIKVFRGIWQILIFIHHATWFYTSLLSYRPYRAPSLSCTGMDITHRKIKNNNLSVDTGYSEVVTLYWTIVLKEQRREVF